LLWTMTSSLVPLNEIHSDNFMDYGFQVFINVTIGSIIGFIGNVILLTVASAGALMNNQIGLSSAMMLDPGSKQQVALLETLFGFIGVIVFLNIGGLYWIISALSRSFTVFPLTLVRQDFLHQISLDYLIHISGNSLTIAVQMIAPIMVVTIATDLILGIVNRTAQQIQVFQLSFALKPCIGFAVFLTTLPIFLKLVENFLSDYALIF